jgi:predicted PhzF superfamily epimerase YddE/YHI9
MVLSIFQVDAFNNKLFNGNPAAVVILPSWLPDATMQNIAMENNLSETAFVVKAIDGYEIRWFTPTVEVDLCGHATLASGKVLFEYYEKDAERISFKSLYRGMLHVIKKGDVLYLDFPVDIPAPCENPPELFDALGGNPISCFKGITDYLVTYNTEDEIIALKPDFQKMLSTQSRGVIVTAPGKNVDFVSRFFAPCVGINEDPVTGSAHTVLAPYWSAILEKTELTATQASERIGNLKLTLNNDRVLIGGNAVVYMKGEIYM